ncbi:MAG: hypothetical protein Kow0059_01220 [Candidatus Sumerlaeia bacterium]
MILRFQHLAPTSLAVLIVISTWAVFAQPAPAVEVAAGDGSTSPLQIVAHRSDELTTAPEPAVPVVPGSPPPPAPEVRAADSVAEQWLRRLEQAFKETRTVRGRFEQTLINDIFSETIEARGEFYYQKERLFRANHELKEEGKWVKDNELLILNDVLWLYSPSLKQAEKFHFGASGSGEAGRLHQMFLGFGPETGEVLRAYEVTVKDETDGEFTLTFRPRDEQIAAEIQFVDITFDKRELLPRRVVWLTTDENRTTLILKNIERNAKLPADVFKPVFPKDTEIIERN